MKLACIASIISDLGAYNRNVFPSKIIKALDKFYQSCVEADNNTERELTPAEHHRLHACIWGYNLKTRLEKTFFTVLQKEECMRLGFRPLNRHLKLFEYLTRSKQFSSDALEALASNNGDIFLSLNPYILRSLYAHLWTVENINNLFHHPEGNVHIHNIINLMQNNFIAQQQTLDLLLNRAQELEPLLCKANSHFLCTVPITEQDLIKFDANIWLFQNNLIWQALLHRQVLISLHIVMNPTNPISYLVGEALIEAQRLGINSPIAISQPSLSSRPASSRLLDPPSRFIDSASSNSSFVPNSPSRSINASAATVSRPDSPSKSATTQSRLDSPSRAISALVSLAGPSNSSSVPGSPSRSIMASVATQSRPDSPSRSAITQSRLDSPSRAISASASLDSPSNYRASYPSQTRHSFDFNLQHRTSKHHEIELEKVDTAFIPKNLHF